MKEIFTADDFTYCEYIDEQEECHDGFARMANDKIENLIKSWPVVYGAEINDWQWSIKKDYLDTHKAHLAFIKEINKTLCKHEPNPYIMIFEKTICRYCGLELKVTWEPV